MEDPFDIDIDNDIEDGNEEEDLIGNHIKSLMGANYTEFGCKAPKNIFEALCKNYPKALSV